MDNSADAPASPDPAQLSGAGERAARPTPVFVRRADSPRRRARILVLITVVALLPVVVGVVASQLAHSSKPAAKSSGSDTVEAPDATVVATGKAGSTTLARGVVSWGPANSRISSTNPPGTASSFPTLRVAPSADMSVDFTAGYPRAAAPTSVSFGLDKPGAPSRPVTAGNPVHLDLDEPAGTYTFVLHTKWSLGSVDYYLRVEVS